MKKCQFLLVTPLLLLISAVVWAGKPDPVDNPPLQVREANVDADGWIAVHEQGVVDAEISNPTDNDGVIPLVVEPADELGKQRISWDCGEAFIPASSMAPCLSGGQVWTVPEGKLLVIETLSVNLTIEPGELAHVDITTQLGGNEVITFIPMHFIGQSAAGPWDRYSALYSVKLYSEYDDDGNPVDTPLFVVRKSAGVGGYIQGSISGYLIDE